MARRPGVMNYRRGLVTTPVFNPCDITVDPSTPLATRSSGSGTTVVSSAFSPPASSLVVILVGFGGSASTAGNISVADTGGHTWIPAAKAIGTVTALFGAAGAFYCYMTTAPGSITATATVTNSQTTRFIKPLVLLHASAVQAVGVSAVSTTAVATSGEISVPLTTRGSIVVGISDCPGSMPASTTIADTVFLEPVYSVGSQQIAPWMALSKSGALGPTTYGINWNLARNANVAAFEVLPACGQAFPIQLQPPRPRPLRAAGSRLIQGVRSAVTITVQKGVDPWPRHALPLRRTYRARLFHIPAAHFTPPPSPGTYIPNLLRGRVQRLPRPNSWTYQEFLSGELQPWNPPTPPGPLPIGPPFEGPLGGERHGARVQKLPKIYPSKITFVPGVGFLPPPPTVGPVDHSLTLGYRRRQYRSPRGHIFNFPLAGAHYTNTTFGAQFLRPRVIWRYSARGRVFGPFGYQTHRTPEFWSRERPQLLRLRRGRMFESPPVGEHYTNTVFGAQFIRPRMWWRSSWRGRVFSPGRVFQYHPPTPWQFVRARQQSYMVPRRGRIFTQPLAGAHYANTTFGIQFVRPRVTPLYYRASWHGRFYGPSGHQVRLTPLFFSRERPAHLRLRRGFITNPYLANAFPFGPGPLIPSMVRPSRWPTRRLHHSSGVFFPPPNPYIPPVPRPVPPKPGSAGGSMSVSLTRRRWPQAVLFEHSKSQVWRR